MTTTGNLSMISIRDMKELLDTLKNMIFIKMTQFVDINVRKFVDTCTPLIDECTYAQWRDTTKQILKVLDVDPRALYFLANLNNELESFRQNKIGSERIWKALVI